jgi:hypothetical protein
MEQIRRFRALERLCRKRAAHYPELKWMWLGQAAKWKVAGDLEISSQFVENTSHEKNSDELAAQHSQSRAKVTANRFMYSTKPLTTPNV